MKTSMVIAAVVALATLPASAVSATDAVKGTSGRSVVESVVGPNAAVRKKDGMDAFARGRDNAVIPQRSAAREFSCARDPIGIPICKEIGQ